MHSVRNSDYSSAFNFISALFISILCNVMRYYINAQVTPCPPKYNLPRCWETRMYTNYFAASVSRKSVFGSEWNMPTHSLCRVKAHHERSRSIRHPQPPAILHLAGLGWQTEYAWVSTCLLYERIILVIIYDPDFQPRQYRQSSELRKSTGENYQCRFFESELSRWLPETKQWKQVSDRKSCGSPL